MSKFQLQFIALCLCFICYPCAFSQTAWQSSASSGDLNHSDGLGTNTSLNAVHPWADFTSTNGAGAAHGPNLFGSPSQFAGPRGNSGAASSAPFQGTYYAPGNIAARQTGGILPPTQLSGFVKESGLSDSIYGDEGDSSPPRATDFGYIEDGIQTTNRIPGLPSADLSTGHPLVPGFTGQPSAWGTPE